MKRIISLVAVLALILTGFCLPTSAYVTNNPKWYSNQSAAEKEVAYSFALVGDTQIINAFDAGTKLQTGLETWAEYDPALTGNNYVYNLYKWIVDNKEARKIEYVLGLGDMTQHEVYVGDHGTYGPMDWEAFMPALKQLEDAGILYSMARGNHDRADLYEKNIGTDYYKANHDGFYGSTVEGAYKCLTLGGTDYLLLTLALCPSDDEMAWASDVIANHPNHKVIINTHGYMANNGIRWAHNPNNDYATATGNSGPQIWDKLVSKHENIFMVVCGHIGTDMIEVSTAVGDNGNTVYQVLVNPQNVEAGSSSAGDEDPLGAVALLNFYKDGSFGFEYYSTVKDKYFANIKAVAPEKNISTAEEASARISASTPGLRFKTEIDKTYLNMLVNTYGAENVEVGTLIAPTDTLSGSLTHKVGVPFLDVKATIDSPYDKTADSNIYVGSIAKIKEKNLERNFTAVGYIKYTEYDGTVNYVYSTTQGYRNVSYVANIALNDTRTAREGDYLYIVEDAETVIYSKYTTNERKILKALIATVSKDPCGSDIF